MISQWMGGVPAIVYSLFAGSLLDQFGCKPFMLLPLVGAFIGSVCLLINFAFIDALPIAFFYTYNIYFFFGGESVFYLGTYSYGSLKFKPESRATVLARYDGFEVIGMLIGTVLSPIVLVSIGAYGNYGIKAGSAFLAFLYILVVIPHSPAKRQSTKNFIMDFFISPIIDMLKTLFKRRPRGMHWLIAIQIYAFASYWFTLQEMFMKYLFMLKVFEGFDGIGYSWFTIYETGINLIGLLVILPIMSNYFLIHDAAMLTICVGLEAIST